MVGDGSPLPDLRLSERLAQPVAVGLIRPTIILPTHLTEQPPEAGWTPRLPTSGPTSGTVTSG